MKTEHLFLSLAMGAGLMCSGLSSAGDMDKYQATITLVNNSGKTLVVSGCNATDKDSNVCHVNGSPLQIQPESTIAIGDATNSEHSAEGYFVFSDTDLPDLFHLNYKFDKKLENSNLGITHASGSSAVNWIIDEEACSSSSGSGAVKCCTYKHHKHHLYSEYEYSCVLPVRAQ